MNTQTSSPKIALVYDWVSSEFGGAELVLQVLHELFPNAPVYTSFYNKKKATWAHEWDIRSTKLDILSPVTSDYRWLAPLMPVAIEALDLREYDVIFSISSFIAKGVLTQPQQLHINYLLSPTRFLYRHTFAFQSSFNLLNIPLLTPVFELVRSYFRKWDSVAQLRPDHFIPISVEIANLASQIYREDIEDVIYPPFRGLSSTKHSASIERTLKEWGDFYLCLSRLMPYKQFHLAVIAAAQTGRKIILAGDGTAFPHLVKLAPDKTLIRQNGELLSQFMRRAKQSTAQILFTKTVTTDEKVALLSATRALILPGIEDFGIVALEAGSVGTPCIIHQESGVAEVMHQPVCGLHLQELTPDGLIEILTRFEHQRFNSAMIQKEVGLYTVTRFKREIKETVLKLWNNHTRRTHD